LSCMATGSIAAVATTILLSLTYADELGGKGGRCKGLWSKIGVKKREGGVVGCTNVLCVLVH